MITEKDLREAIAECEGERNPNANTCIKLAAFYTIKNTLYPVKSQNTDNDDILMQGHSFAQPFQQTSKTNIITVPYGDSEFMSQIQGLPEDKVWSVIDELMDTLSVVNHRLYESVMRKLQNY